MDEEERRDDSLTDQEARDVDSGKMDAEESHRYEEFRDLRDMIEGLRETMDEIRDSVRSVKDSMGAFVENGAVVRDEDEAPFEAPDAVEYDTEGNIEEYVYQLDDLDLTM